MKKTTGCLATSPPPEFDLVPLEVGLVLHHFDKTLRRHHDSRVKDDTFNMIKTSNKLVYYVAASIVVGLSASQRWIQLAC